MADKKTKKDFFNELLALATTEEQKAFIKHELELLGKKHNPEKPTKAQEENSKISDQIVSVMENLGKKVTISELQKQPELEGLSNQKVSALMRLLVLSGTVIRTEEKRVAYFEVVSDEPETEEEADEPIE